MEEVARVVLALEQPEIAEEVVHFLDRSGAARVVGTASDGRQLVEAIRQLAPDAILAAPSLVPSRAELNGSALLTLDTTQSVASLRRAIRAGASGFFLWPAEREALGEATAHLRPPAAQGVGSPGHVVAVCGARGGVGATFVTTHLAAALARRGRRCVLVDLDLAFADAAAALGVPADEKHRTIADLLPLGDEVSPRHVEEVVWPHPQGFGVLLAPDEGMRIEDRADQVRAVVSAVRQACEVVVLHLPRGFGQVTRAALDAADCVVMVIGLDVMSFRDAKRLLVGTGIEERCSFVVNRARRAEITPNDIEPVFGSSPVAVIPSDRAVPTAQDHGRLLPMRGRVGRAIDRLARRVMEEW
ncbi:MAG TPA: AAA family ATPase [Actinomycetota bacterium]|nr:AAA family ATPase [Actinomycetota bacterium]